MGGIQIRMYFSFTRVIEKCSVWLVCVIQDLGCDFVYLDSDFNCQEARIYIKIVYLEGPFQVWDFKTRYTKYAINGLGFNKFLGNQGAIFNCPPSNIVVNCIVFILWLFQIILGHQRPSKGNQGYCIFKIKSLYLHREIKKNTNQ